MNQLFEYFLNNYLDGEKYDDKTKGYHKVLVDQLPEYIRTLVSDDYVVKGSCASGYKAEIPWIGIFNKNVTTSAQYGLFMVYLFKADMSGFYLCLSQGVTNFQKYGKDKYSIMVRVANYFKDKIGTNFSKNDIDLLATKTIGKQYEEVNIISKYYSKDMICNYNFESDLLDMLNIYKDICDDMQSLSYDEIIDNLLSNTSPDLIMEQDKIKDLYQSLLKESNLDHGDVVTLSRVDIPTGRKTSKYKEITTKTVKKVDYAKLQKKNAEIGFMGEKVVYDYEVNKLRNAGREDLVAKIQIISTIDDRRGYDIIYFDENGEEIYIEVKTTEGNGNLIFFISDNELKTMEEKKSKYYVYRVFNVNSSNPNVFILDYEQFKSRIELSTSSYRARLIS